MTYDVGDGEQRVDVYIEPSVEAMYQGNPPASTITIPRFEGFTVKFMNMSARRVKLYWVAGNGGKSSPMNIVEPFHEAGTASFPGHNFVFASVDDPDEIYHTFNVGKYPDNLQIYDPYLVENDPAATEQNLVSLNEEERQQYEILRKTFEFSLQYQEMTGRPYLANYLRDKPKHHMWPAQYFGKEHWVESKQTHFTSMPPDDLLHPIEEAGIQRVLQEADPPALHDFRSPTLNMSLVVKSVTPRIFEIHNFLSNIEVDHILKLAGGIEMARSTVGNVVKDLGNETAGKVNPGEVRTDTRTSRNAWVQRNRSPIVDSVYRRAADLMQIDEALFRDRDESEAPDFPSRRSLAEQLQLVHYVEGQEYTAHHDFGYRDLKNNQRARFATLLLYLNDEGLEGGETEFPRWKNAETFLPLRITPEAGKAVLFYSQLPDGNFDDFSQHAAVKPRAGEKWLINLWVWDPLMAD